MSLPLYPDGCIVPNIRTRPFMVYLAPKCEHKMLRGAYIAIMAESADAALIYVGRNVRLAGLEAASVVEMSDVPDMMIVPSIAS